MASQIDRVAQELRRRILEGTLPAGKRVVELQFSEELQVSRTPLRLALEALQREGLLERLPTRGFRVRNFTMKQVADAVDVRGNLEGMAARLAAEQRLGPPALAQFDACIALGQRLIDDARAGAYPVDARQWSEMNRCFHGLLVQHSGNAALEATLRYVSQTPMVAADALTLQGVIPELGAEFIQRAQNDHVDCVAAIRAGSGARAEAIMREHAYRSRTNKEILISRLHADHGSPLRASVSA